MPSPGAVWPATVTSPLLICKFDSSAIVPETLKSIIRGPNVSIAARKLPSPESFKLVTYITFPPRPPVASCPKPSALVKAFASSSIGCFSSGSDSTPELLLQLDVLISKNTQHKNTNWLTFSIHTPIIILLELLIKKLQIGHKSRASATYNYSPILQRGSPASILPAKPESSILKSSLV